MLHLLIVKKTRTVLHTAVIRFITIIPLGLLLIPRYGVTGLITANVLGAIPSYLYGVHWVQKNTEITPDYPVALKTITAATISTITTHLYTITVQLNPWIELITGGTLCISTYLISILLLKILKPRDLENLTNIATALGPLHKPITWTLNKLKQII
jgi:peptidoglycan biosynthesis protein MviN/MurJ (putative lipid II flippase)